MRVRKSASLVCLILAAACGCSAQSSSSTAAQKPAAASVAATSAAPTKADYLRLRDQVEQTLLREMATFYPACIDKTDGGFMHAFPAEWAKLPASSRQKYIVFQARMTWTAAEIANRRPALREQYLPYAQHGFAFLKDHMWDAQDGGFFWTVASAGEPVSTWTDKHTYGNAFGIYASATVFDATKDPAALQLALKAFHWLDERAHDDKNGGYYETLTRSGQPIMDASQSAEPNNPNGPLGDPHGYKTMNSHIHLMEALAVLAPAAPDDPLVRKRLDEVFLIVRDKIAVKPGCLNLVFTPDWKPVPQYDSFGHDIETTYLLDEADTVRHGAPNSKTRTVARMLTDHALSVGWDNTFGGFYDGGRAFGKPEITDKVWWTQAEGLNSLLLLHEMYGQEDSRYWNAFLKEWQFIQTKQIDPKTGGWFNTVTAWGGPKDPSFISPWKADYHSGRAMLNVADRLSKLAEGPTSKPAAGADAH